MSRAEIKIKDIEVLRSLMEKPYAFKLVEIIDWIFSTYRFGVITEGYRKSLHPNDLHGVIPVRAIDMRSWCYDNPQDMADNINSFWEYDYERPQRRVAVYHKHLNDARHFHIQVHPNTRWRGKDGRRTNI